MFGDQTPPAREAPHDQAAAASSPQRADRLNHVLSRASDAASTERRSGESMTYRKAEHYMEVGCRIPKEYFWVIGWGESDVGIETGSYDAALHMAGIENYNVLLYTSVLPPETVELPHLPDIHHGSVLEGIIAVQHTDKPERGSPLVCS